MKKVFLLGLLAGVVMLVVNQIVGQITNLIVPNLNLEYLQPGLFRPWSDPLMSLIFVHPFILGIILAFIWNRVKSLIKAKGAWERGFWFAAYYFLITISGMLITYSSFPVSLTMVLSWTISGFIQVYFASVLFARLNK